jgi:hypothetical protein
VNKIGGISTLRRIRGIRNIPINLHWYWQKSFKIYLYIKRIIHINHQPRLKELRRRCRQHWKTKKKVTTDAQRSVLKRKNKVAKGGASSLGMKGEHESTNLKAHKMMKGKVEPFVMPTMV